MHAFLPSRPPPSFADCYLATNGMMLQTSLFLFLFRPSPRLSLPLSPELCMFSRDTTLVVG